MKSALVFATLMSATLAAAPAYAQDTAATPEARVAASAPATPRSLGMQFEVLPLGTLTLKSSVLEKSSDATSTYAIGGFVSRDITPHFSLGVAPRMIFGVAGKDDAESAKELDVRLRATLHRALLSRVEVFGSLEPGYSIVLLPTDLRVDNPSGLVVALASGVTLDLDKGAFMTAEVSYQLGFQALSSNDVGADLNTSYLAFGLGLGVHF
jgi:hypothetical protein